MTIAREEFLDSLAARRSGEVVVHTMGTCNYWPSVSSGLDFFLAGAMGFASSLGLGIALAVPDRGVWVLDGDGSLLMNLGSLVTCADAGLPRYTHFVLDNGMYELTGRVPVPGARADFVALARAAGYGSAFDVETRADLDRVLVALESAQGPSFVRVAVAPSPPEPVRGPAALAAAADVAKAFPAALAASS